MFEHAQIVRHLNGPINWLDSGAIRARCYYLVITLVGNRICAGHCGAFAVSEYCGTSAYSVTTV